MSNDRLTELERRLALAEHEAQTMREQLRALQLRPAQSRSRRDGIVVLLGLVLMFAAMRALDTSAQTAGPQVLTVKAPFQVLDAAGQKVLLKVDNEARLTVGDPAHGNVNLGVGTSGAGFVAVTTADGHRGAGVGQYQGQPLGLYLFKSDGVAVAGRLALVDNEGRLTLGEPSHGGVELGLGTTSGAGYVAVRTADGHAGAGVGQYKGRPLGLYLFKSDGVAVAGSLVLLDNEGRLTLGDDKSGGVDAGTASGAGFLVVRRNGGEKGIEMSGGRITLAGPAGKQPAIVLGEDPDGGFVSVYGGGGSATPVAALQASSGTGNVYVFNAGGQPIASLSSGNNGGTLQLTDMAGTPMVQAGTLADPHVGVVRTGPASRAPGGLMGVPGSYITGKGN